MSWKQANLKGPLIIHLIGEVYYWNCGAQYGVSEMSAYQLAIIDYPIGYDKC